MNRRTFVSLAIVLIGVGLQAQNRLAGKWEGTTASGTPVVLVISVKDKDITGTFTLAGQSVPVADGKVDSDGFTFKVTVEGHPVSFRGRQTGDVIELTSEDIEKPVTLKRAK
jgi:hypothetical protein